MSQLHRIVYCSRSLIEGPRAAREAETRRILARSRRNNGAVNITGALMFSDDCFAQVLEGPLEPLTRVFERIQRDPRHHDVAVLNMEATENRYFPGWTMAYAGEDETKGDRHPLAHFSLQTAFAARTEAAGHEILDLLRKVVVSAVPA